MRNPALERVLFSSSYAIVYPIHESLMHVLLACLTMPVLYITRRFTRDPKLKLCHAPSLPFLFTSHFDSSFLSFAPPLKPASLISSSPTTFNPRMTPSIKRFKVKSPNGLIPFLLHHSELKRLQELNPSYPPPLPTLSVPLASITESTDTNREHFTRYFPPSINPPQSAPASPSINPPQSAPASSPPMSFKRP